MPQEASPLRVKERITLHKYEGDPSEGRLIETVEMEDGKIIGTTRHDVGEEENQE